jgi:hypothetical protein
MLKSRETVERYRTRVLRKAVERGKVLGAFDNAVRTKPLARYWWHRSCVGLSRDTRRCSS